MVQEDNNNNGVSMRRRVSTDVESGSVGTGKDLPLMKEDKKRRKETRHYHFVGKTAVGGIDLLRLRPKACLVVANLLLFLCWCFLCQSPKLRTTDPTLHDILWRTFWRMPGVWFRAKFRDPLPSQMLYKYILRDTRIYQPNTDENQHRWAYFINRNTYVLRTKPVDLRSPEMLERPNVQSFAKKYPNIGHMFDANQLGKASVLATQIRFLINIVKKNHKFAFLFQDDVLFIRRNNWPIISVTKTDREHKDVSYMYIEGPSPVDVIFLTPNVTQAVKVTQGMIRVLDGFGSIALLVTKRGAQRLLEHLEGGSCFPGDDPVACKTDTLDVAMMKYAQHYGFEIYLPALWPLIKQSPVKGTMSALSDQNYMML